ncbi:MarR family winged helix-turn-helix transcriptional regulator [Chachezhania sediminis]|uniref:MarR family winged helix-turn-helix transcriptional regulator n=1 Tax=Chachezhania sediminis TaxID=2599291 RepID=UPI00131BEFF7|nr:MarR family winged helix-turn-helix transcriptional regulator [Chachezhania sediminis]
MTGKVLTVRNPDFIVDGSDDDFRTMLHNIFTIHARLEGIRAVMGNQLGLTGGQWTILQTVAHLERFGDVAVKDVAEQLGQSGAFITIEVGKLVQAGLLSKTPDPRDRRRVRLALTALTRDKLARTSPILAEVNDQIFDGLDREDFVALCRMAGKIREGSDKALVLAQYLMAASQAR